WAEGPGRSWWPAAAAPGSGPASSTCASAAGACSTGRSTPPRRTPTGWCSSCPPTWPASPRRRPTGAWPAAAPAPPRSGPGRPRGRPHVVVPGGATRPASVRAGLAAVPDEAAAIVVHDPARPVPVPHVWRAVLEAVAAGADAAVPGVPVTDTLRSIHGGVVDRSSLVAVQTPQAFRAAALRAAHADGGDATDDASLVEARGGNVVLVDGDPRNVKITTPADLSVAELHCR